MIKNYLITAWRNLTRNKAFSLINMMGLALGLACSLMIMLWVQNERSVDGFHANGDQLYQVYERNFFDGKVEGSYLTQGALAEELKRQVPELQYTSSLEQNAPYPYKLKAGDKIIKANGSYAGADFFTMFSFPLIQGTAGSVLTIPSGIAISHKLAEQFFGNPENAMGKTIRFENQENLQITGIFENPPMNSSLQFDFLRNWTDYEKANAWLANWGSASPYTLVQLRKDADPAKVQAAIKNFIQKYRPQTKDSHTELYLQPFTETYLHADIKSGQPLGGRIEYIRLFSLLATFILVIACINFMNLATARAARRAKEVGVRKVIGAARLALVAQFIGEALMISFFSIIAAVILVQLFIPAFNELTGKQLVLPFNRLAFWGSLLALLTITGVVAGSYPAIFLSRLNPVKVLKGSLKFSSSAKYFRQGLVVFQFALSILLIVGMIVIYKQIDYTQTRNLGYDRDNLIYIPIEGDMAKNYDQFKEETIHVPGIRNISKMKESPTVIAHHNGDLRWVGRDPDQNISFADAVVGFDFVKTMNIKLVAGRDFSKDYVTDATGFILNESAIKKIGYTDPIGKPLWWGEREGKIVGVLKDFHFNSLHQAIEPLVIRLNDHQPWGTIMVRVEAGKTSAAIASLERIVKSVNPENPFTYQFADLEYSKLYRSEQIVSKLTNYFATLAIFISCLGLFGLATFTAEQRSKELGIRKVLGASSGTIFSLLSSNFLRPVLLGMLIAFPVAWLVMNEWLSDFAYKIDLDWSIFAVAAILSIGIALATVSFQGIKSAIMNPIKSLRTE